MVKSKSDLNRIFTISLLFAGCLIIKNGYETEATTITKRLTNVYTSVRASILGLTTGTRGSVHQNDVANNESVFTRTLSTRSNIVVGRSEKGFNIRAFNGTKLNTNAEIVNRDAILNKVKNHVQTSNPGNISRQLVYKLLNYEPDTSSRKHDLTRVYKHRSTDNDISVKVKVDHLGDLKKVTVRADGKRHKYDLDNAKYVVKDVLRDKITKRRSMGAFYRYDSSESITSLDDAQYSNAEKEFKKKNGFDNPLFNQETVSYKGKNIDEAFDPDMSVLNLSSARLNLQTKSVMNLVDISD